MPPPFDPQTKYLDLKDSPFGVSSGYDTSFLDGTSESFEAMIEKQFYYTSDIGAVWYRAHIPYPFKWGNIEKSEGIFDFSKTDILVVKAKENNNQILAQLFPFAEWDQENFKINGQDNPDCIRYIGPGPLINLCGPYSMEKYKNFVRETIRRYGDDIKFWEIMNEPPSHYLGQARGGFSEENFLESLADDYVEVLKISYEVIKEECDDCTVLLAGLAGIPDESYTQDTEGNFIYPLLNKMGQNYFDVFNFHCYSMNCMESIESYKSVLEQYDVQKSIWLTETGEEIKISEGRNEITQAQKIPKQFVLALASNIDKIFFHCLTGSGYGLTAGGCGLGSTGIECAFKRLSYYTFKLMVKRLDGSDWDRTETIINGTDNVYAYKFIKKDTEEPVWVVWWDYFEEEVYNKGDLKTVTLDSLGISGSVEVTDAIPNAEAGLDLDENDYPTFFNVDSLIPPMNLMLKESPVFIEPEVS